MFKVIYDYIGENDSCRGIEEECSDMGEAMKVRDKLKAIDCYCNIDIIDCNFE